MLPYFEFQIYLTSMTTKNMKIIIKTGFGKVLHNIAFNSKK